MKTLRFMLVWVAITFATSVFSSFLVAQTSSSGTRITEPLDERDVVALAGDTHPLARPEFDQGPISDTSPLSRVLLLLRKSPMREVALQQLLAEQQDKSSPNYHSWLTPQEFGQRFGVAETDLKIITQWLSAHGFSGIRVSNGRNVIEFSGTAGAIRSAFHTQIHRYSINGIEHIANEADPQIPVALQPVIAGIVSLHDFRKRPFYHLAGASALQTSAANFAGPNFTFSCFDYITGLSTPCHPVGPYDFATIYNLLPLWNAASPIDGTGQTIAIVGRTNINVQDAADFRNVFGMLPNPPQVIVDGTDPGLVPGDETEADLDVEWSGAVAKNATIKLVASQSTQTTDGVDLSALYIVDNDLAPVMSESYGQCEFNMGAAGNQFYSNLWQQAAAEGITVFVSSGDNGSAGCDFELNQGLFQPAQFGLQVNGIASSPYDVAVGGTDFNDYFNSANYWNTTSDPTTQQSVKAYVPETTWNDTCTNAVLQNPVFSLSTNPETNCNNPNIGQFILSLGGGGGKSDCTAPTGTSVSNCAGGYAKPPWQSAPGVPNDQKRDLPDVSLFASNGFANSFYMMCETDAAGNAPCSTSNFVGIGGTSASSPAFAGLIALVNQQTGSRQGNANYVLYGLAAKQSAANCNSTSGPSSSCVFNDVTAGTIGMPCVSGSLNCATATAGDANGILSGYQAGTGYDLATGLGSVNAYNLVTKWNSVVRAASTTTLNLNGGASVNATHGSPISVAVSVSPNSPQPTGSVSLIADQGNQSFGFTTLPLTNGSAAGTTNMLPGGPSYPVHAHYSGDANYLASDSSPTTVTMAPESSTTSFKIELLDWATGQLSNPNATSFPYGSLVTLRAEVGSSSGTSCFNGVNGILLYGCPTGSVSLALDGSPVASGTFPLNSEGSAESQNAQLTVGPHSLTGNYSGDNSYLASSSIDSFTVVPAPTLTGSQNFLPISIGVPVTVSVTARSTNAGTFPVQPGGTFTILDGSTQVPTSATLGNGVIFPSPTLPYVYVLRTGQIQFTPSGPPGAHTLTVNYSGDANYAPSSSGALSADEVFTTQTAVSSSSTTIQYGQPVTLTANILPSQNASSSLSGSVSFRENTLVLGTAPVTNNQAQITVSSLNAGTLPVTAIYSGDSNYATSSGTVTETVTPASTSMSLTSSAPTVSQGVSLTLQAQINPAQMGVSPPTGIVQFTVNGSNIGGRNLANNQAQIMASFPTVGTAQVQASYSGDLNYSATTGTFTETVVSTPPDFSITSSGATTQTVTAGQAATFTNVIAVSALYGFTAQVNLSCAPSPPGAGILCSVNPRSFANGSGTASVIVTTAGRGASTALLGATASDLWFGLIPIFGLTWSLAVFVLRPSETSGRPVIAKAHFPALVLLLVLSVACGGGNSGTNPPAGTPAGTYTITVTGTSGAAAHGATLTLIVH